MVGMKALIVVGTRSEVVKMAPLLKAQKIEPKIEMRVCVMTDSCGVRDEAPSLRRPIFVTRETTERPEAVTADAVRLVGMEQAAIFMQASHLHHDPVAYAPTARASNPYGDGKSALRIRNMLVCAC
jgi:UDP-N-acetylglucosamine 2-epimerase